MSVMVGDHDSSMVSKGLHYHFFHVTDAGKAMQTLKDATESAGLLSIATIWHAESPSDLRVYCPLLDPQDQAVIV
jgi:hypothetical protein